MRKLFGICLLGFGLIPWAGWSQTSPGFTITGRIKGLKEGDKVLLTLVMGSGFREHIDWTRVDSAVVKNGEFDLRGVVPEGPRLYILDFPAHQGKWCRLFIGNEQIRISSDQDIDSIHHEIIHDYLNIDGSRNDVSNTMMGSTRGCVMQIIHALDNSLAKIEDSVGFDPQLVGGLLMARKKIIQSYFENTLLAVDSVDRPVIPDILEYKRLFDMTGHSAYYAEAYDSWSREIKSSFYGKLVGSRLGLCEGQAFPVFPMKTPEGNELAPGEVIRGGKLTLVNFWSTHSYQRKKYQDELMRVYRRYHGMGLNIIGISSDTSVGEWKGFLDAHRFPWYNVSDLKGSDGVVNKVYQEFGNAKSPNTTNVLIDGDGKIVAWDPTGVVLQWYLWKYLGS